MPRHYRKDAGYFLLRDLERGAKKDPRMRAGMDLIYFFFAICAVVVTLGHLWSVADNPWAFFWSSVGIILFMATLTDA
jgi:hypothetical protein